MSDMKIGRVRNVDSLKEYYFNGALHLGGCNRIHVYRLDNPRTNMVFKFNMKFSYLLLKKYLQILPEYYREIYKVFTKTLKDNGICTDVENLNVLQTKLDNIGYSFDEEYELWNFLYKGRQSYYVDDMFPRIRKKDVDNAIGNAQYTIMLDGIERFKEDWV